MTDGHNGSDCSLVSSMKSKVQKLHSSERRGPFHHTCGIITFLVSPHSFKLIWTTCYSFYSSIPSTIVSLPVKLIAAHLFLERCAFVLCWWWFICGRWNGCVRMDGWWFVIMFELSRWHKIKIVNSSSSWKIQRRCIFPFQSQSYFYSHLIL